MLTKPFDQAKFDIISEYEEILLGTKKQFSVCYFTNNPERDCDIALAAFQYLFEKILCWDIPTIEQNLSYQLLKEYKLNKYLMTKIIFKNEAQKKAKLINGDMTKADIRYLIHLIYGNKYPINIRDTTIETYEEVLNGKIKKFPKGFFSDGYIGPAKACICLQYAINQMKTFTSVESLYKTFSDKNIFQKLAEYKLEMICKTLFETPVDFLHKALPTDMKDEDLFEQYKNKYKMTIVESGRRY